MRVLSEKPMRFKKTACACARCQSACLQAPGWFRPGEAEKAAKLLGLSLPVFFRRYLGVNWWEAEEPVFVLAPAVVGNQAGHEYPGNPRGQCVFFENGKCRIHAAKPYDCSHGNPHDSGTDAFWAVMEAERAHTVALWSKHQGQIQTLLGRKPRAAPFSFLDCFAGHLWGGF